MNYRQALEYIHGTRKLGWKLGLDNIRYLLNVMGNPHNKLKFVHIAGTNGKGSTAAFLSSILVEGGYKVGIFTSPYLRRFSERIRIGKDEIDSEQLAAITSLVKKKIDKMVEEGLSHPTEFEIVTAIAMEHFCRNNCDIVVLEVGLGGRFDSTNVIETPLLSVITTISYDHMDYLGNTLLQIAFEKAGIIKENGDVVLYPQEKDIQEFFRKVCDERNARLFEMDASYLKLISYNIDGQVFDYESHKSLSIGLLGEHQTRNAALAVKCADLLKTKGYNINNITIKKGLKNAKWPGRLQIVNRNPIFIIDGAHNVEGVRILRKTLDNYFHDKKKTVIIGVLKDKEYKSMMEVVIPSVDRVITITPKIDRALPAKDLAIFLKYYCNDVLISDTIEDAIRTSLKLSSPNDVICAFGSFYYIGEVISFFENYHNVLI